MPRLPLLAVIALAGLPLAAQAAPRAIDLHARTAGDLAKLCAASPREASGDAKINYCHGFAQGVVDTALHYTRDHKVFCLPDPAPKRSTTLQEFVKWVQDKAERGRMAAAGGLVRFLHDRFPCQ